MNLIFSETLGGGSPSKHTLAKVASSKASIPARATTGSQQGEPRHGLIRKEVWSLHGTARADNPHEHAEPAVWRGVRGVARHVERQSREVDGRQQRDGATEQADGQGRRAVH